MHVPIRRVAGMSTSSTGTEMSHNFDNASAKHVAALRQRTKRGIILNDASERKRRRSTTKGSEKLGIMRPSRGSRQLTYERTARTTCPCFDSLNYRRQCNRRALFRVCTSKCEAPIRKYHKIAFPRRLRACEGVKRHRRRPIGER